MAAASSGLLLAANPVRPTHMRTQPLPSYVALPRFETTGVDVRAAIASYTPTDGNDAYGANVMVDLKGQQDPDDPTTVVGDANANGEADEKTLMAKVKEVNAVLEYNPLGERARSQKAFNALAQRAPVVPADRDQKARLQAARTGSCQASICRCRRESARRVSRNGGQESLLRHSEARASLAHCRAG